MNKKELIKNIDTFLKVQLEQCKGEYDAYNHGMFNGMEMIAAMVKETNPTYLTMPDAPTSNTVRIVSGKECVSIENLAPPCGCEIGLKECFECEVNYE